MKKILKLHFKTFLTKTFHNIENDAKTRKTPH